MRKESFWEKKESFAQNRYQKAPLAAIYEDIVMFLVDGVDGLQEEYSQKIMK